MRASPTAGRSGALLFLVLAGGVGVGACADDGSLEDGGGASRTDSAGVEIVLNAGPDRPLAWTFERVLTLGGADTGPESFFRVQRDGVALDGRGRIYVLDTGNRRVQLFDGSGAHLLGFGEEGEGPGEFRFPTAVSVTPSGHVIVWDVLRQTLMAFDASGGFLGQRPVPGGLFGFGRADDSTAVFAVRTRDGSRLRIRRADGTDTTEILELPLPKAASFVYESCGIGITLPPLFADPPTWDVTGDRLLVAEAPEYGLRVFEGEREVARWRRGMEPEQATEDAAALELGEGESWSIGGGKPCVVPIDEVLEKRGIADRVPLIGRVAGTPGGGAWVRRKAPGADGPIDVFDATGAYRGTLPADAPWPATFGPDGRRLLALEEDELGVQRVVLYRIPGR